MRRILLFSLITALAALSLSALPAFSADSGAVNMTIEVASPCILVAPDNVALEPATFSASEESPSKSLTKSSHQVQNCAGKSEPLFARTTNAVGSTGATWLIVHPQTIGLNRYALQLDSQPLSASDEAVSSGPLAAGEARTFNLMLWMPTAGSDGSGQTMSMSLTYTATF
jgi:hypothetical protein